MHARRARFAVARLAAELGEAPPPGRLRAALAEAVGDPSLEVAYWLPATGRYVDASGRPTEPPKSEPGRAVTPIVRAGEPVALVGNDSSVLDGRELVEQIGSTARLAVDSERLRAEILGQLADLSASRARIVETSDRERRRLERNLHDGAQQRLLAVSYELRLALEDARADGDDGLASHSRRPSRTRARRSPELEEPRAGNLSSGARRGRHRACARGARELGADRVDVVAAPEGRYPAATETAAFVVVTEALRDAVARHASFLTVRIEVVDTRSS